MTEEQLQLLRAARPSGQDEHEPGVAAARASAAGDADVVTKLEDDRQTDLAMQGALKGLEPPVGLEAALLTAMRAARGTVEPPRALHEAVLSAVQLSGAPRSTVSANISRRRWLGLSAAAAAVVAAGGAWWWREYRAFSMRRLSEQLAVITRMGVTLSVMSMDKSIVIGWLRDNKAPRADALPDKLDALGRKGCHLYDIEGHPVSLECLLLPGMREIHLFCTPAAGLIDPPADGRPAEVLPFARRTLATWTRGDQTLLLFCEEPVEAVRNLVT